ncbi:MAG TPA: TonB-dependent receptor plug domain-containing protein [Vicinamibacterales bacterium]|nr:TonB-dependent receptor plug domain-containing protein [Vicinamibacterales bacterium]
MRVLHSSLAMLLMGVAVGCGPSNHVPMPLAPDGSLVYTSQDIAKMQVSTAWDVVEWSGKMDMSEAADGRSATIRSHQGRSSLLLASADMPLLIIDGVRVDDPRLLRRIPAPSIEVLSITDGMHSAIKEGTNSTGGVISVTTKSGD